MSKQYTSDWNERYLKHDTPWEESTPSYNLKDLLNQYTQKGQTLLDIGCGLGSNARWLAGLGYQVTAIDISEIAIEQARKSHQNVSDLSFECIDFLKSPIKQTFDIIFDKGVLHSFSDVESHSQFAQQVAAYLKPKGIWINISGNADTEENLEARKIYQYPRMSLRNISISIEPHFEVLEVKRNIFGEKNNFLSWVGVYMKRGFYYSNS